MGFRLDWLGYKDLLYDWIGCLEISLGIQCTAVDSVQPGKNYYILHEYHIQMG